jgi:hypothetical protein
MTSSVGHGKPKKKNDENEESVVIPKKGEKQTYTSNDALTLSCVTSFFFFSAFKSRKLTEHYLTKQERNEEEAV